MHPCVQVARKLTLAGEQLREVLVECLEVERVDALEIVLRNSAREGSRRAKSTLGDNLAVLVTRVGLIDAGE